MLESTNLVHQTTRFFKLPFQTTPLVGVSLLLFNATNHLYIDASLEVWGAHLNYQVMSGLWSSKIRNSHISVLELKAVIKHTRSGLGHFGHQLGGTGRLHLSASHTYPMSATVVLRIRLLPPAGHSMMAKLYVVFRSITTREGLTSSSIV